MSLGLVIYITRPKYEKNWGLDWRGTLPPLRGSEIFSHGTQDSAALRPGLRYRRAYGARFRRCFFHRQ